MKAILLLFLKKHDDMKFYSGLEVWTSVLGGGECLYFQSNRFIHRDHPLIGCTCHTAGLDKEA